VTLRLLVDRRGRVVQGEVVGVAGDVWRRFVGWRGMARALRDALARQAPTGATGDLPDDDAAPI
jgi:hypothetical protein